MSGKMQLPHDVRGLMPFHTPWWEYALWALGVLAIGAAVVVLARYLMSRKGDQSVEAIDPWVGLAHRLSQLKVEAPFGQKTQENFFYSLSLMLREGIELRTEIPATDRTFKELKDPLRRKLPLQTKDVEAVLLFLERADMVKFAGMPATADEAEACLASAKLWLAELKPKVAENHPFHDLPHGMDQTEAPKRLEMG